MSANATQTATPAQAAAPLKYAINGAVPISFYKDFGATAWGTTSDCLIVAKIPKGATFLSAEINISSKVDTGISAYLALQGTVVAGTLSVSNTGGAGILRSNGVIQKVSLSDDAALAYATLGLFISAGTQTASVIVQGVIMYGSDA